MDNARDHIHAETPNAERYFRMTEEEKDIELQRSLMRMHYFIYKITRYDVENSIVGKE